MLTGLQWSVSMMANLEFLLKEIDWVTFAGGATGGLQEQRFWYVFMSTKSTSLWALTMAAIVRILWAVTLLYIPGIVVPFSSAPFNLFSLWRNVCEFNGSVEEIHKELPEQNMRGCLGRGKIEEVTDNVGKLINPVDLYCIYRVGCCDVESHLTCADAKVDHVIGCSDVYNPCVSAEAVSQSTLKDVGGRLGRARSRAYCRCPRQWCS